VKYKSALVTGGAGFIGSHLSRALLERGMRVAVIDDLSMGRTENLAKGVEFVEGDVRNTELVVETIEANRVDVVFHEAARVSVRASVSGFVEDASSNIMGTLGVLGAVLKGGVKKAVYASSMAVYADSAEPVPVDEGYPAEPASPYGIGKLAGEKYWLQIGREASIESVALRYFNTYGAGQGFTPYVGVITIFINRLLGGEPLVVFGDGEQRRDYIHVSDVVRANLLVLEVEGVSGIFNVGTGKGTTVNELARIITSKLNPGASVVHEDACPGELRNAVADISLAAKKLGFIPRKGLDEAIDEVIEWNKERNRAREALK